MSNLIIHGLEYSQAAALSLKYPQSASIDIFSNWNIPDIIDKTVLTNVDGMEGAFIQISLYADFGPFANKPKNHAGLLKDYPLENEYVNYGRNASGKIGEMVFWTYTRFTNRSLDQIRTHLSYWYHREIHLELEKAIAALKVSSDSWVPFPIKKGILWAPNSQIGHVQGVKLNPEWGNVILDVETINYLCSVASFNGLIIKSEAKTNMFMRPFKILSLETNEVLAEVKHE